MQYFPDVITLFLFAQDDEIRPFDDPSAQGDVAHIHVRAIRP
jgi:hypothetical protein